LLQVIDIIFAPASPHLKAVRNPTFSISISIY